jgi:hypothetical protein
MDHQAHDAEVGRSRREGHDPAGSGQRDEAWKAIPGYEGYEASDQGRIRSVSPRYQVAPIELWLAELVGARVEKRGALLAPWIEERHGRKAARVCLTHNGAREKHFVHRLVCLAFHGVPGPEQTDCAHLNHNSLDNRASNLAWQTHSENVASNWSEEAIERRMRWEDDCELGPSYNGPDRHEDIPF